MIKKSITEEEIIEAIINKDEWVYSLIIARYRNLAYSIINGMHNGSGVKEHDVLETFHDAIIKLKEIVTTGRYDSKGKLSNLLGTLIKNTWIDKLRKKSGIKSDPHEPTSTTLYENILKEFNIKDKEGLEDRIDKLRICIEGLNEQGKKIIHLRFYKEMSREDAAAEMNLNLDNFKYHYRRCLTHLRNCLGIK